LADLRLAYSKPVGNSWEAKVFLLLMIFLHTLKHMLNVKN